MCDESPRSCCLPLVAVNPLLRFQASTDNRLIQIPKSSIKFRRCRARHVKQESRLFTKFRAPATSPTALQPLTNPSCRSRQYNIPCNTMFLSRCRSTVASCRVRPRWRFISRQPQRTTKKRGYRCTEHAAIIRMYMRWETETGNRTKRGNNREQTREGLSATIHGCDRLACSAHS
jgi:hypothetical protein